MRDQGRHGGVAGGVADFFTRLLPEWRLRRGVVVGEGQDNLVCVVPWWRAVVAVVAIDCEQQQEEQGGEEE